jgi:hypothetical protein
VPEMRGKPHGIYAQVTQVIQLRRNTREVADPVAIAVREAAQVDPIKDGSLPPFECCHARDCSSIAHLWSRAGLLGRCRPGIQCKVL